MDQQYKISIINGNSRNTPQLRSIALLHSLENKETLLARKYQTLIYINRSKVANKHHFKMLHLLKKIARTEDSKIEKKHTLVNCHKVRVAWYHHVIVANTTSCRRVDPKTNRLFHESPLNNQKTATTEQPQKTNNSTPSTAHTARQPA